MSVEDKYIRPEEASRLLKITVRTLLNWDYKGKVKCIRTKGGHRRFLLSDILEKLPEEKRPKSKKRRICYCRVSTRSQKEDLERQVEYFRGKFPDYEIVQDFGSGINFKRRGFNSLLDSAIRGNIEEIVVTHKDRLCRFGFELIERIVQEHSNGRIVVLNQEETSPEKELVTDLLSIITVFSSRLYGLRSHSLKRKIKAEALKNSETTSISESGRKTSITDDVQPV